MFYKTRWYLVVCSLLLLYGCGSTTVAITSAPLEALAIIRSKNSPIYAGYQAAFPDNQPKVTSLSYAVPAVQCTKNESDASVWIGMGPADEPGAVRLGTLSKCVSEHPQYSAWWETIPSNETQAIPITVHSGDTIQLEVDADTAETYTIKMTDTTVPSHWSTPLTFSRGTEIALCGVEAPQQGVLAHFDQIAMTCLVGRNSVGAIPKRSKFNMADNSSGNNKAITSDVDTKGSFTVTWLSSSTRTQPPPTPVYSRSYYMQDVSRPGMARLGGDDADWANSQVETCKSKNTYQAPGANYIVLLQFGHMNYRSGSYGAFNNLVDQIPKFTTNAYFASNRDIEQGVKAYLQGFKDHIHQGAMITPSGSRIPTPSCVPLHLMLGIDNLFICYGATDPCNPGDAATQWANLAKDLYFSKENKFGYIVGGAIDAETTFSPGQDMTTFIDSFDQTRQNSPLPRLVNFGDVRDYPGRYDDLWSNKDLKYIMEHTDIVTEYFSTNFDADEVGIWNTFWQKHSDIHANYIGVMTECSPQPKYYETPANETNGFCIQHDHYNPLEFAPMKAWNTFLQNAQAHGLVSNPATVQLITNIEWQPPAPAV